MFQVNVDNIMTTVKCECPLCSVITNSKLDINSDDQYSPSG